CDLRRRYSRIDRPRDREIERILVAVIGGKADLAAFRPRAGSVELYRERVRTIGGDRRRESLDQAEARRQHWPRDCHRPAAFIANREDMLNRRTALRDATYVGEVGNARRGV